MGQRNIDSAMAGILMATMPITTILLSHFFLVDEKINQQKFIGFLISFFGVFILIYREDLFVNNSFSTTLNISASSNVGIYTLFYSSNIWKEV
jgi:drug/metabolite transporter (DMT)-like permease